MEAVMEGPMVQVRRVSQLEAAWGTHIGHVRPHNEDAVTVVPLASGGLLAAVADGMGGHQAGEVASEIAIATLSRLAEQWAPDGAAAARVAALRTGLMEAATAILDSAGHDSGRANMGAAAVVAAITPEAAVHQHAGDCRLYWFRDGQRRYRTHDHTMVEVLTQLGEIDESAAHRHPLRSQLYSCLGGGQPLSAMEISPPWHDGDEPEAHLALATGDLLLLCSDGLHTVTGEERLQRAIVAGWQRPCDELAQELIDTALRAGGNDNISVVLVRVTE